MFTTGVVSVLQQRRRDGNLLSMMMMRNNTPRAFFIIVVSALCLIAASSTLHVIAAAPPPPAPTIDRPTRVSPGVAWYKEHSGGGGDSSKTTPAPIIVGTYLFIDLQDLKFNDTEKQEVPVTLSPEQLAKCAASAPNCVRGPQSVFLNATTNATTIAVQVERRNLIFFITCSASSDSRKEATVKVTVKAINPPPTCRSSVHYLPQGARSEVFKFEATDPFSSTAPGIVVLSASPSLEKPSIQQADGDGFVGKLQYCDATCASGGSWLEDQETMWINSSSVIRTEAQLAEREKVGQWSESFRFQFPPRRNASTQQNFWVQNFTFSAFDSEDGKYRFSSDLCSVTFISTDLTVAVSPPLMSSTTWAPIAINVTSAFVFSTTWADGAPIHAMRWSKPRCGTLCPTTHKTLGTISSPPKGICTFGGDQSINFQKSTTWAFTPNKAPCTETLKFALKDDKEFTGAAVRIPINVTTPQTCPVGRIVLPKNQATIDLTSYFLIPFRVSFAPDLNLTVGTDVWNRTHRPREVAKEYPAGTHVVLDLEYMDPKKSTSILMFTGRGFPVEGCTFQFASEEQDHTTTAAATTLVPSSTTTPAPTPATTVAPTSTTKTPPVPGPATSVPSHSSPATAAPTAPHTTIPTTTTAAPTPQPSPAANSSTDSKTTTSAPHTDNHHYNPVATKSNNNSFFLFVVIVCALGMLYLFRENVKEFVVTFIRGGGEGEDGDTGSSGGIHHGATTGGGGRGGRHHRVANHDDDDSSGDDAYELRTARGGGNSVHPAVEDQHSRSDHHQQHTAVPIPPQNSSSGRPKKPLLSGKKRSDDDDDDKYGKKPKKPMKLAGGGLGLKAGQVVPTTGGGSNKPTTTLVGGGGGGGSSSSKPGVALTDRRSPTKSSSNNNAASGWDVGDEDWE